MSSAEQPPMEPPGRPRINVNLPLPVPPPDGEVRIDSVTLDGHGFVRFAYSSATFGIIFIHIPAENSQEFGVAVINAGKAAKTPGLVIAQAVPPNGDLRQPGV